MKFEAARINSRVVENGNNHIAESGNIFKYEWRKCKIISVVMFSALSVVGWRGRPFNHYLSKAHALSRR
jgi:hypothetical protein